MTAIKICISNTFTILVCNFWMMIMWNLGTYKFGKHDEVYLSENNQPETTTIYDGRLVLTE